MCKDSDTRACLDVSGPLGLSKGGLGPQARGASLQTSACCPRNVNVRPLLAEATLLTSQDGGSGFQDPGQRSLSSFVPKWK